MNTQLVTPEKVCVAAYNHHDGYYYWLEKLDGNTLYMNRKNYETGDSGTISLRNESQITKFIGPVTTFYLCCHPTQNKLYLATEFETPHFHQVIYELDLETNIPSLIYTIPGTIVFMSVVDDTLVCIAKEGAMFLKHVVNVVGFVRSTTLSAKRISDKVLVKRTCPDRTEQLVALSFLENSEPDQFFRVFDPKTNKWASFGKPTPVPCLSDDYSVSTECLSNGDLCVRSKDPMSVYILSFSENRWTFIRRNSKIESMIALRGHPILFTQCKDERSTRIVNRFLPIPDKSIDESRN
jgi:hypothetical protein